MLSLAFLGLSTTYAQGVGIGTTDPHASSILDVESTEKGFLPPRMNTTARDAINGGVFEPGLTIYNTDDNCLQWWNGTDWFDPCDGSGGGNGGGLADEYPPGTVFCASGPTEIVEVTSAGGRVWMDRNLGASQQATSIADAASYGDLYQWGRAADGHQCRNSPLHNGGTLGLATTSEPNTGAAWDGHFITVNSAPNDWLQTQDDFLWNTNDPSPGKGATDPCPTGYRLPTEAELNAERTSWSSGNSAGAFDSPLKLPAAGRRYRTNGSLDAVGSIGSYWSSSVSGTNARRLGFSSSNADMSTHHRADGRSVRCLKD